MDIWQWNTVTPNPVASKTRAHIHRCCETFYLFVTSARCWPCHVGWLWPEAVVLLCDIFSWMCKWLVLARHYCWASMEIVKLPFTRSEVFQSQHQAGLLTWMLPWPSYIRKQHIDVHVECFVCYHSHRLFWVAIISHKYTNKSFPHTKKYCTYHTYVQYFLCGGNFCWYTVQQKSRK